MSEQDAKYIPLTRIQKLISQRMLESKQTQPCFYMTAKADVGRIGKIRRPLSKELGVRISMNDFFLRAMAVAIEKYPLMAGTFKDDYIEIAETIDVGLAVAAPKGLVVPVIKNANKKSLADIAKETMELIEKARNDKLSLDELAGACMTLTALGMFGIDSFLAIPSPGQCGILSVGKISEEPVLHNGKLEAKKVIKFGLAADHRIITPAYGAEFLAEITSLVSSPEKLTG
ncbi:MAG: 2-oxo acid dehydrogenase subunit E2 [Planctomycetes bacterium]|nr:2-oxo acid dehydrogenase subunit E2 [Planctomycetota bacterium]MBU1519012.1 2-oxo acid dehydrogenase subunit E2 [Planctomycetota bacterium]MBU2458634.1 2-oxo acid dehydrogenase subunit E2 [Planctomycetota bacterium]MBU2596541.1 2-oxo acid dehydrogenase subunit E2 [Planctomycetota bacterium]